MSPFTAESKTSKIKISISDQYGPGCHPDLGMVNFDLKNDDLYLIFPNFHTDYRTVSHITCFLKFKLTYAENIPEFRELSTWIDGNLPNEDPKSRVSVEFLDYYDTYSRIMLRGPIQYENYQLKQKLKHPFILPEGPAKDYEIIFRIKINTFKFTTGYEFIKINSINLGSLLKSEIKLGNKR